MSVTVDRRTVLLGMTAMVAMPNLAMAEGAVHEILMLNEDPEDSSNKMVYDPLITVGKPGDTFRFVSTDKGHNTVSLKGGVPEGAESWKSRLNQDFEITLDVPGVYGFVCVPHTAMGMVGLIIVQGEGMADNAEAVRGIRQRGKRAREVWEQIWAEVDSRNLLSADDTETSS